MIGNVLPPVQLPGVPGRVHRNDTMIPKATPAHADGYNWSGYQAAAFVTDAVLHTDRARPPVTGLDLGCGYGRVLRHLVTAFPKTEWTACDLDARAVRFCQREFGATPVYSEPRIRNVDFPDSAYDVVWMGSLLTHLDAEANAEVVATLARITRPGGVVAFSAHGPGLTSKLADFGPGMERHRAEVDASIASSGFSYVPYPHYRDGSYGIAFHDPAYIDGLFGDAFGGSVARVDLPSRTWMGGHDLHAFAVTAGAAPAG